MNDRTEQSCPLCDTPAHCQYTDGRNRKLFSCSRCTQFEISVRAEARLLQSSQEWRDAFSKLAASAPADTFLEIRLPSGPGSSQLALVHSYVQRSSRRFAA